MPDRQPSVPCPACGAGASLLFALWPCGLGRPFKAPTAQLGLPQYDTADSGPPWRHSLAVTALALCPFSTASLMHGAHMSAANPPALPPMPASASAWRLILSSRRAPLPCWACTSRRPASYVGSNHGDQPLWTLARLSFALELRACLSSSLGLAALRSFTVKLPAAPLDGPDTMAPTGTEGLPGDLECRFAISSRFRLKY